jgi:hypothetical protein
VERSPGRLLVLLSVFVALVFVGFMLAATKGHVVPQVVDLYVVCQYARAMAEGHPFQYNPGEAPSTGATSLLHTTLLAAAHALGARGEGLVAFAIAGGAACFVASVLLARRIGVLVAGEREGTLAGALLAVGGPAVWGFLYGSDVALFMFLSLWLLERLLSEWSTPSSTGLAVAGSLLALTRPEGLPMALLLAAAWTFFRGRSSRGAARLLSWIPVAAGALVLGLNRGLTGAWLGSSVLDKSLIANYGVTDGVAIVAEYLVDATRGLLLGFYPSQAPVGFARGWAPFYFPPLGLILVLLALARPRPPLRIPLRLWAFAAALVLTLTANNIFIGVHFNRYLLWVIPSLLVLVPVGLGELTRLAAREDSALERALFRFGAGLFLVLGFVSTVRFATLYGDMAGEVYRRDVAAAEWIRAHLPRGVAMANVATSVEYLTGHRNTNLHGVTSPAFFGNRTAEREAGVFEALGRLPEPERPPYLITSVATQSTFPTLRELVDGAPLFRTASLSDDILVHRMRYDLVGKNGRIFVPESRAAVAGLTEVDRLNVCDSRDESSHDYRFVSSVGNVRLTGTARIDGYLLPDGQREAVIDGGRAILGEESFQVRTRPGRDLIIVLRTSSSVVAGTMRAAGTGAVSLEIPEATLSVEVEDAAVTREAFRPTAGWNERVLRVSGAAVRGTATRLRIRGRFASFHYWFFQ